MGTVIVTPVPLLNKSPAPKIYPNPTAGRKTAGCLPRPVRQARRTATKFVKSPVIF